MSRFSEAQIDSYLIRDSQPDGLPRIQAIYAHHVQHGTASFEESPPEVEELSRRRATVLDAGLPFLVASSGTGLLGFAYASPYHARPAYRYTLEDSIYVAADSQGLGIGGLLLGSLIERCESGPWRQMLALIGDSHNAASIALHERHGFAHAGTLRAVGFKFDTWLDCVLMQRGLDSHGADA